MVDQLVVMEFSKYHGARSRSRALVVMGPTGVAVQIKRRVSVVVAAVVFGAYAVVAAAAPGSATPTGSALGPSVSPADRAAALLAQMTLEEKIGQLEVGRGSLYWNGRNRKSRERVDWSRFADMMDELAYGK